MLAIDENVGVMPSTSDTLNEKGQRFVQLPTDFTNSSAIDYEQACYHSEAPDLAMSFLDFPGQAALFVAALSALLHRYTQQDTLALDLFLHDVSPVIGRQVALNAKIDAEDSISVITARIYPVLVAIPEPDTSVDLLVQSTTTSNVAVTFNQVSSISTDIGIEECFTKNRRPYDLHFFFTGGQRQAPLTIVYNSKLFNRLTIDRFVKSFFTLFVAAQGRQNTPISLLPIISETDVRKMTLDWDSGQSKYFAEPVFRLFQVFARKQPEAVAATFHHEHITYAELEKRSNQLAQHLVAAGVRLETRVAVCVQPSLDILVALLAIFKAGAVYVPLDPTHPKALITSILDEAQPRLVLTQSKLRGITNPDDFPQFCFDTDWHFIEKLPVETPLVDVNLSTPGYLLYTSGTTGKPKGVLATHGNLAHYIHAAQQMYGFCSEDVFCSLARYTFSISLFELVSPLCCGGTLLILERDEVLSPDRLTRTLQVVTVLHAGPSLLGGLFRYLRTNPAAPRSFPGMRHASSGGDLVPPHLLEEMKLIFNNAEIYVIYGCTEISCMGTTYPVNRSEKVTRSYVGKPFPDVAVRVLDSQHGLTPIGVVGEICFSGKGVVPGYLNRPELTAEKFVKLEGRRFYQTGDMGRFSADGNLEILGRRDFQVQLRGIRIELAAIENTIRELGLATQCAVVVKRLGEQDDRLVAFVVKPQESGIASFREALAQQLPDYMLPQHLVVVEALPLTANGKLDRNRLLELPWESQQGNQKRTAPRNAIERQIADAFIHALGIDKIGIDDDFFDLGGHSLLAVMVTQELENKLGLSLPPDILFQHATVRTLAEHAQNPSLSVPRPILLTDNSDKPSLFMIAGVHLYRGLAKLLEGHYSVYGVYASSELTLFEASDSAPSLSQLARDYVEIIRRQQPSGPYLLAGMSFGGIVVYEIAQQLRESGEMVAFLGLLDAILPEQGRRGLRAKVRRLMFLPWRDLVRVISTRLGTQVRSAFTSRHHAGFVKYENDEKLSPMEDLRVGAYSLAAKAYLRLVRPYPGKVTLIVAGKRLREDMGSASCGWSDYIPSLNIHIVDSDHLALLEEPKVSEVADIFLRSHTAFEMDIRTAHPTDSAEICAAST